MSLAINVQVAKSAAVAIKALQYNSLPKSPSCPVATGTLNGAPYTFKLTKGKGRGSVMMHYAYFMHDGKIYYFTIGKELPGKDVNVTIGGEPVAAPAAKLAAEIAADLQEHVEADAPTPPVAAPTKPQKRNPRAKK